MPKKKKKFSGKVVIGIAVLVIIGLVIVLSALSSNSRSILSDKVAIIYIKGAITAGDSSGLFSSEGTSSTQVIEFIDNAEEDPSIKAVLFEINSPGGTAVASKEIADRVKRMDKYKVALVREAGVSGAYWIATACDKIIANDLSIVGSIGVISSYLEFSGLLDRYNVTYQRMVSGKYKDIGTPFKKLTHDEEQKLQVQLDSIHQYFINEVALNRNMEKDSASELATGEFFIGFDALDLGLVDVLGDKSTAKAVMEQELNTTSIQFVEYKRKRTIFDAFSQVMSEQSFSIGRGIGASLFDLNKRPGLDIIT